MSISIGNGSNLYTNYNNVDNTASSIENTGNKDLSKATDNELMDACKEYETYFVEQMYKAMEKTVMKDEDEENEYESYFGDMRTEQYAKLVTEGEGIGIAKLLYEQMKHNYDSDMEKE